MSAGLEPSVVLAVQTDEEDRVAVLCEVLGAISMVHVPVEHQYLLLLPRKVESCNCHVVHEAEAPLLVGSVGMVSGGTHVAEGRSQLSR